MRKLDAANNIGYCGTLDSGQESLYIRFRWTVRYSVARVDPDVGEEVVYPISDTKAIRFVGYTEDRSFAHLEVA